MAATITGTPAVWTSGNVTVPSDCNAIYGFWFYYSGSAQGGLSAATIGTTAFTKASTKVGLAGYFSGGVIIWYNPPTGSQTVSITWSPAVDIGPLVILVFVKDADTTGERDADAIAGYTGTAVTIDTNTTDLVIKAAAEYNDVMPGTGTGWTSIQTGSTGSPCDMRVSICDSPGASTTTCNAEATGTYLTLVAIAIKAGAAAATSLVIPSRAAIQSILTR